MDGNTFLLFFVSKSWVKIRGCLNKDCMNLRTFSKESMRKQQNSRNHVLVGATHTSGYRTFLLGGGKIWLSDSCASKEASNTFQMLIRKTPEKEDLHSTHPHHSGG